MKIVLDHEMVVKEMKGSFWEALKIILFLQEQMSDMELRFIYSLLFFSLFLCDNPVGIPLLTAVVQIRPNTDG